MSEFQQQEVTYASTLETVDAAENAVVEAARLFGLNEDQQYEIGMAVRESMVNAVMHGNKQDPGKKVRLTVQSENDGLSVVVEDEGEGLDLGDVANPTEGDNLLRDSGRGLLIIQAYTDEFAVERRQPRGTRVRMVKRR
jgi:serine/threonine-protein kinase RsbW